MEEVGRLHIQLLHCWHLLPSHCSQLSDVATLDESNYHSLLHKEEKVQFSAAQAGRDSFNRSSFHTAFQRN